MALGDLEHPATGEKYWEFRYGTEYRDRYGYGNGPRASPVIDGHRVYTAGVTAIHTCLDLKTGAVRWRKQVHEGKPETSIHLKNSFLLIGVLVCCTADIDAVACEDPPPAKPISVQLA